MTVSMSAVWDRTSEFLGAHKGAVAGIAALTIFLPAAIKESLSPLAKSPEWGTRLSLQALSLALGLVALWGQLAITALALAPDAGAAAARGRASRRFAAAIVVALVLLFALFVLALPILAALVVGGIDLTRVEDPTIWQSLSVGATAFTLIYGLVLLIVVLFLSARFGVLVTPIVLAEDRSLGAIGRAFRLSRGLTWKILGVLLLYAVVSLVAVLAAETVFGTVFALIVRSPDPISVATVLTAIVAAAIGAVFSVLSCVFVAKLYLAARAREDAAPA